MKKIGYAASTATAALAAHMATMPRAVFAAPKAKAGTPEEMFQELASTVEAFKKANEELLKGKADVVVSEKVDRIDAAVEAAQKAIDELNIKLAAQGVSVDDGKAKSEPGYIDAFKAFMRKGTDIEASMKKAVDGDGGYLAPVEWDRTITDKLKRVSMIRQKARQISISSAGFKKLFNDRAVGSGWVGEVAARPETSTPTIGTLDFTPGELYANPAISQGLLDDAEVDLEAWLASEVDTEFARQEGIAFLGGDGVNKPFGILTYVTGAANAARHPWGAIGVRNSTQAASFTADSVLDLIMDLPVEFRGQGEFYVSNEFLRVARKLKDGQGNYLWQPSYVAGAPQSLAGYAVNEMPDMPTVAANNIIALFGDMEATYLVVDRIGIRVLRDPYTNKPFVHFYTTKRVGGGVFNPEPMKALRAAV
jgi:HK97 family phage major capsid protein